MEQILKVGKCYLDKSGAARIYIPLGLVQALKWNNMEGIVLIKSGKRIEILSQKDYGIHEENL